MKYYVAYGSNLNKSQMAYRCPESIPVGAGVLKNYRLSFYGVASIEPKKNGNCPVGVWEISDHDERCLDAYEGWPNLYRKEIVMVTLDTGEEVPAIVYIMNRSGKESKPSTTYFNTIFEGYADFDIDTSYLVKSVKKISPKYMEVNKNYLIA